MKPKFNFGVYYQLLFHLAYQLKNLIKRRIITLFFTILLFCYPRIILGLAGDFLKVNVSARSEGMAGAYTAVADDTYTLFHNPAGLSRLPGRRISCAHIEHYESINYENLCYTQPLFEGGIGVGITYLYIPKFDHYLQNGERVPNSLSINALGFFLGYGDRLFDLLDLGINLKFINEEIVGSRANLLALDIGMLLKLNVWNPFPKHRLKDNFSIGISAQNIANFRLSGFYDKPPVLLKGGISYLILNNLRLATDINANLSEERFYYNVGLEYLFLRIIPVRIGFKIGEKNGWFNSGLGVNTLFGKSVFNINYSFSGFGELGITHRVSVEVQLPKKRVIKPRVSIKITPKIFTPDNDGVNDKVVIIPTIKQGTYSVSKWKVTITDKKTDILFKEISGVGEPPVKIIWDGTAYDGRVAGSAKEYVVRMIVEDIHKNKSKSNKVLVKTGIMIKKTKEGFKIQLSNIGFDYNKAIIKKEFYPVLEKVIAILSKFPDYKIRIEGHTDNIGSMEFNDRLSLRRALSVKRFLVQRGIDEKRITVKGYGFRYPLMSNDTEEGRAENRRVEFIIIKPDAKEIKSKGKKDAKNE